MMKMSVPSRSRVFLVEFIVVILFFSIAAAIIVRVFAVSHGLRLKANELTIALAKTQSIAEYAKASETKSDYIGWLEKLGATKQQHGEKYIIYYNKDWELQPENLEHTYSLEIELASKASRAGELLQIYIRAAQVKAGKVSEGERSDINDIYQLQTAKYYPKAENQERDNIE